MEKNKKKKKQRIYEKDLLKMRNRMENCLLSRIFDYFQFTNSLQLLAMTFNSYGYQLFFSSVFFSVHSQNSLRFPAFNFTFFLRVGWPISLSVAIFFEYRSSLSSPLLYEKGQLRARKKTAASSKRDTKTRNIWVENIYFGETLSN